MKRNLRLALSSTLLLVLSVVFTYADNDDLTKKDLKQFEGTWQVASLEVNGNKTEPNDLKKIFVINEADGVMSVESEGKIVIRAKLTIYPTQKPKTVDMTGTDGDSNGKTMLGIYEFEGETRKVCYAETGKERPTDFSAPEGSGRYSIVLKRVKK
jgi:uncharacterized protein (TIGR03067 family)